LNKRKIINDPVYGFISIPYDSIYELLEHPYFQRLRRIGQLGLTYLVYPGATHTRFHHALGAMHLLLKAVDILRQKGIDISEQEREASAIAILLHDIGHGPFSHTLEHCLIPNVSHEEIGLRFMQKLQLEVDGPLEMAIAIFTGKYPKQFLNQLISSQLDMDRLDYLTRDSFYTGVSEGIVGLERIIMMLNVVDGELVIEEKGIYSIEKFIVARRLMYWQVYLHKTSIAADRWLIASINRAKELYLIGDKVFLTPSLEWFIKQKTDLALNDEMLDQFSRLDDSDILVCLKYFELHPDKVLSKLSKGLVNRKLPRIKISSDEFTSDALDKAIQKTSTAYKINAHEASYLVQSGSVKNEAYRDKGRGIPILMKNGTVKDIAKASDNYSISALRDIVTKFFLITPR
jgi:HD superfamily phosphohydrolase